MHTQSVYPHLPLCKPAAVKDAKRPHGLVLYSTSATHESRFFESRAARLKKMKRTVITSARIHAEHVMRKGFRPHRAAMLTLTYRPDVDYSPRHISNLLECVRKWLKRRGIYQFRYVWVLELTKNGKPHYHIMFFLPKGITLPKPDKQGWWPHGQTKIEWAKNPVGYLAKYASKGGDGWQLPSGARLHGSGGFTQTQRDEKAYILAPGWIRSIWPNSDYRPRRALGGGWMSMLTGHWFPSPFLVRFDGKKGGVHVRPMETQAFVLACHDDWRSDQAIKDMVKTCLDNGGKVVQLSDKKIGSKLLNPMTTMVQQTGLDQSQPEYWHMAAKIYCKCLDAMDRSDVDFMYQNLGYEWQRVVSALSGQSKT